MSEAFSPVPAILGGVLIGLSASLLLWANGQVAGISSVWGRLMQGNPGPVAWRLWFAAGLVLGGLVLALAAPHTLVVPHGRGLLTVGVAGVLVGVGTRMGNGCTSGHGVCGLSRGSTRSAAAVATFMAAGAVAATAAGWLGGAP